jgi:hypothetical protein
VGVTCCGWRLLLHVGVTSSSRASRKRPPPAAHHLPLSGGGKSAATCFALSPVPCQTPAFFIATRADASEEPNPAVTPAQLTIPAPFDFALPRGIPLPQEFVSPLGIYPRRELVNPYPDRPECEEEWSQARAYCDDLEKRGLLGVGDYRGMGRTFRDCVMGQVSADCGGNPTA